MRAIKDYILSHQGNTDILPPLKFFLIISSGPSRTLEAKLKTLTNEVGIPVRFISAFDFTYIIDNCNWTVYPQILIEAIVRSSFILDSEWSENLIQGVKKKKNAFTKYVELINNTTANKV